MNMQVPERAERLAKWSLAPWERQAVLGDLQEEFLNIAETTGSRAAHRWYWRHALLSVWPNVVRRARGDEHRANRIRHTANSLVQGVLCTVLVTFGKLPSGRRDVYLGLGALSLSTGLVGLGSALFRQRVRVPPKGNRIGRSLMLAYLFVMVGVFVMPFSQIPHAAVSVPGILLVLMITAEVMLRRGTYPPPAEYFVRKVAASTESADKWLELDVPNAPLALSSMVLCHGQALLVADGVHSGAPTIERSFQRSDVLRLYTIINAPPATATARLEVVTTNGDVRLQHPVAILRGQTEEVVKKWDDVADRELATDFGEIDVRLSLADLEPGRYRLRLTVDDGERTSMQQERIEVRA